MYVSQTTYDSAGDVSLFLANYTRGDQQEPMGTRPPWPTKPRVYWFLRIKYIYIYNILIWVDTLNIPESSKFNLIVCCVRTTDWIQLATVVTRFVVKALFLLVEAKILMIKAQCLQVAYFGWYFGWISLSTSHSWLLKWYCFNSWFCWLNSHWICSIGLMSHVSW